MPRLRGCAFNIPTMPAGGIGSDTDRIAFLGIRAGRATRVLGRAVLAVIKLLGTILHLGRGDFGGCCRAISAERDQIFVSIVTQQTSRAGGGPEDDRNCRSTGICQPSRRRAGAWQ